MVIIINIYILVWRSLRTLEWNGKIKRYKCRKRRIYKIIKWRDRNVIIENIRLILSKFLDSGRLIKSIK